MLQPTDQLLPAPGAQTQNGAAQALPGQALPTHALPAGKLPPWLLDRLLRMLPTNDARLLVGPSVGEDAAVVDFAPNAPTLLVVKSDPITFATDEIGYYAVNVCANDIGVAGARPLYYLPTLLLPAGAATAELAERIFAQIGAACRALNVVVAGGHSEVTHAVTHPVVAGSMVGEVARNRWIRTGGCRAGDVVLMAGAAPIEGASILAREQRHLLLARGWALEELETAANFLFAPGISVLAPALLAADAGLVTAMHDPTEGGVATALAELAAAAQVGLRVELDAIPLLPLAQRLCAEFGLDPLGTIASGALLAGCAPQQVAPLQALWAAHGYTSAVIGHALPAAEGLQATRAGQPVPFPTFAVDELARLWAG